RRSGHAARRVSRAVGPEALQPGTPGAAPPGGAGRRQAPGPAPRTISGAAELRCAQRRVDGGRGRSGGRGRPQRPARSRPFASGLFGDGAAAAVLDGGARGRGPRIAATRSVFYPGSERVMGWDVVDSGFKVVLSPAVPQLVREKLRADVDAFLSAQGLKRSEIAHFICHTGGPKVLEACEEALEIPRSTMQRSWDSLQK